MNFSYFKFMRYINKHKVIHYLDLATHFGISEFEAKEIANYLYANKYVSSSNFIDYVPTYKGKHFIRSAIFSFINVNFIDILALIVSIIALIISILK